MTTITVSKNGPLLVKGIDVALQDAEGNPIDLAKTTFALCRCGGSQNKPFCDGAHKRIEFQG